MRGFSLRTQQLRKLSVESTPKLSLERALIETDIYKEYYGKVPIPILRALNLKALMQRRELYLGELELIVGEKSTAPQTAPTFPELCCHTIEDLEVLNQREYIGFKINKDDIAIHKEIILPYWEKRSTGYNIMESMTDSWKDCYHAGMFTEFMVQRAPGHTVADDKFYKKGFLDFKKDIEEAIQKLDTTSIEYQDKKSQLEAMAICCDAIIIYGERYKQKAIELAEKEQNNSRKEELLWIASNCDVVPSHAPKTFAQAVQMYWFVHIGVTTELNTWDAFSPGKLDQYLYPFYKNDIENGIITREKAVELLSCLWIKFNNQPAPPKVGITVKESGTYTDFANINTGGINPITAEDGVNEVSYIILDVMDEMKLLQPSSNVQISAKTPKEFLERSVEISRKGWGQPAFYNTEELIEELINAGKEYSDALYGGASGCVETGCHGREAYVLTGYLNVPKILEVTLNNGYDKFSNKQIGLKLGDAESFDSYQKLYDAFISQLKYFVDVKMEGNDKIERIFAEQMPSPFLSILTQGCIDSGRDYNAAGAKYNTRYIQIVGIGTITDSLSAIKYNIFDNKNFSMTQLKSALDSNFDNDKTIKNLVSLHTPKYGNDDSYADDIMIDVFEDVYSIITGRKSACGAEYRIDMLPTTAHVYFGSVMGASPNGRLSNKPLTDGISPEKGADIKGPTAVICSASKMNHSKTGGTLLNQKFTPKSVEGELGIKNLSALVRSYFKMGGHHIQFNVIDRSVLLEAQKNPDQYRDLIVRVAGYSDNFNNLEKELQDEIINRTEHSF